MLWSRHALPFSDYPTLTAARDRLLWQHLTAPGICERLLLRDPKLPLGPFTQGRLMAALLNDLLSDDPEGPARKLDWQQAVKQLAAKAAGAKRSAPDALRTAVLGAALRPVPPPAPPSAPPSAPRGPIDYPAFAADVKRAAEGCESGRFGAHKVFISHVYRRLAADGGQRGLDLASFKDHLLEAMRLGLIALSRADMSYALDQTDVAESSVPHLNDTLHFVRLD